MSSKTEFELKDSPGRMDDTGEKKRMIFNRRFVYAMCFLFVAVPVITGVLVWYLAPRRDKYVSDSSSTDKISVGTDKATTGTPEVTTTEGPIPGQPWTYIRLPSYIIPRHYDLTLYPNFYEDNGWFNGNETVEIEIAEETRYVLIHYNLMNITATRLTRNDTGEDIEIAKTIGYPKNQFWVVETKSVIPGNNVVNLHLSFEGSLTASIVGFYKSTYVNSITNKTRSLATSMFEPVDARKAFPCFDEPNIKAEYTVTLIHRPGYTALSNMPEQTSTEWSRDLLATRFKRSVPMSTYLVCFIVCDFLQLNTTTKAGRLVRVWATPDKIDQAEYALKLANNTMDLFEELFNQSYPLPKQDMIAIPDFEFGAMEHWGLITYRETNMLFDPNEASASNKQRVAAMIAHELAHQWFGNIVTMDWWDDLWLNEGFASFVEYFGVQDFERDWEMMSQFVLDDIQPVMTTDSAVNSHPIVVPVNHPDEINEVFDSISYSKGASVIGMLQNCMGQQSFFKGIQIYLKRFEWKNARTDDLWQALSEVEGAPDVKWIMDTWTLQMGLPYINITVEVNNGVTTVRAHQERFLLDPNADPSDSKFVSPYDYTWYVPLDYVTSANSTPFREWMNRTDVSFEVPLDVTAQENWVKFNVKQTGFYRVNYPVDLWRKFGTDLETLGTDIISPVDRAGLLSDAFNLARAGLLSYDVALDVTKYLHMEQNYFPWESAAREINYISRMFEFSSNFGLWRSYMLPRMKPVLNRLGWDDTGSHLDKMMRSSLIALVCGLGDEDCLSNATGRFRDWVNSGTSGPPNLRSLVYRYGIQASGNTDDWEFMWKRYMSETVPQERSKLLSGMARTRQIWLIYRFLNYAMDEKMVRSQDFFSVLSYLSSNSAARDIVWRWARENWEYLVDRFSLHSWQFGRMIPRIITKFNTEFQLQEVKDFFAKYPDAGAGARGRLQALERIRSNIEWLKMNQWTITEWLEKQTV